MQFRINLATRSYINSRQLNLAVVAMFMLLLLLMFFTIRGLATNSGEMERVTGEMGRLQQTVGVAKAVPEKEYQALLARIRFANGIIGTKSYNWLQLLDRLEEVVPDNVTLSSIEPDPKGSKLKLAGSARSFSNLRRFMENLELSDFFSEVYLTSQAETKVSEKQKGLNFSITCKVAGQ